MVPQIIFSFASAGYRPGGLPLYWRDEQSGRLVSAVMAFNWHCAYPETKRAPTAEELTLLWDYVRHHVGAPCWDVTCRGGLEEELAGLRQLAAEGGDVAALRHYVHCAIEIALDPF